jgi:hypothetical protein
MLDVWNIDSGDHHRTEADCVMWLLFSPHRTPRPIAEKMDKESIR